jgi:hypothetical protein
MVSKDKLIKKVAELCKEFTPAERAIFGLYFNQT